MLSALMLGFLFVYQTSSLSVLTDEKPKSEDTKADLTRQLLNQETVIRMNLDRKVYDLMRDIADMKTEMADIKTKMVDMKMITDSNNKQLQEEIKETKKEVLALKHENSALKAELQLQSNETTLISADLRTTSRELANIKTKMADMKTSMESNNKQRHEDIKTLKNENEALKRQIVDQSNVTNTLADNISSTINLIKTDVEQSKRSQLEMTDKVSTTINQIRTDVEQSKRSQLEMTDNINTTVNNLKADVEQSQKAQLKLSSAVSSLEVLQNNMSSLSSYVKETRVGFTAGVTSSSSSWSADILVFPHVVTNTGNGYSTNTGKFTAPRTGTYVFFVTVVSWNRNYLSLAIVHNGADKVRTDSSGYTSYQTGTNLAVLQLRQGDTVWVRRYYGTGWTDSVPYTTFSGFLL